MDRMQQYRGLKDKLPTLLDGELGYCTDTKELFIGSILDGNTLIGKVAVFQQVNKNKKDIANNKKAITAIQTDVGNINTDVTDIKVNIGNINTDVSNIKTELPKKLTAVQAEAVAPLADTATLPDVIKTVNAIITNLQTAGITK